MANIILENISKSYDGKTFSVKDFSLEIKDGEFIVFVGPSGCGKSTTLRMIAGLEEISDGELYIDGELMNTVAPKDRDLAMVFQSYALYPHMDVYDNMAYPLRLRKTKKENIDIKVKEVAQILELGQYLNKKPGQLSGGQKQRVALGRCMVRDAKAFLMDEPLSNLDAKLRTQMRSEISSLQRRLNKTFVYVTHDQIEAMTMGDRIVVMNQGQIQQVGTPYQVYTNPKNIFVAGFIGSPAMNFLDMDNMEMDSYSFNHKDATLGIRPEDIRIGHNNQAWNFSGKIESIETLGAEKYVRIKAFRHIVLFRDRDNNDYSLNDYYDFSVPKDKLYYFHKESGKAL